MVIKKLSETAMAFPRQVFVARLRDRALLGAFGEFMCRQVSLAVKKPDHWTLEVKQLLQQVTDLMDPIVKVKVKRKEDALREALADCLPLLASSVVGAKTKVSNYYPTMMPKIKALDFEARAQFKLMLEEFLPEYLYLLG